MHRLAVVIPLLVYLGCSSTDGTACRIGADCPSGACAANGQCVPVDDDGSAASVGGGGGSATTSVGGGGATSSSGGGNGQGGSGLCAHNNDAVIEESELFLAPGLTANQRVAQDTPIDTAGAAQPDGTRVWDLTVPLSGDHATVTETLALDGLWYAPLFPTASYAARLTDADDLIGVYEVVPNKVLLLGVVSPADGLTRTELTFDPPVVVLDLPLSLGKTWTVDTMVTGVAQGVAVLYTEDYAFSVDVRGQTKTPLGDFDVLRVHSELVRTVGLLVTTVQSHAFMAECFGTVGSITSLDNELNAEFTDASEVRRLAP